MRRWSPPLVALGAVGAFCTPGGASAAPAVIGPGTSGLSFAANFSTLAPWTTSGGGAQCANYNTPSKSPRLRGSFYFDTNVAGVTNAGRFTLPADPSPSIYPFEACDLHTGSQPIGLGTDGYYRLMVYVPQGWSIPTRFFTGVEIEEYHFQNIYGAPISFQLHADHVTLALQTGACNNHMVVKLGCAYHSNADNPNGNPGNLAASYVIPPGGFRQGAWNDMLMHVHWASDSSGQIQTWYRTNSAGTWTQSSNVTGIPTVQWNVAQGCCGTGYVDETEAYTGALSAPLSLWLANDLAGSTLSSVTGAMGSAPAATTPPAGSASTTAPTASVPVAVPPAPTPSIAPSASASASASAPVAGQPGPAPVLGIPQPDDRSQHAVPTPTSVGVRSRP